MVLEEILLEQPDNQKQLHLLVDLVDDAGGNLCGGAKDDIHELPHDCFQLHSCFYIHIYIVYSIKKLMVFDSRLGPGLFSL